MGEVLMDCDAILGTHSAFLLGTWLADARRWAAARDELPLYEFNARMQLTLWAPDYGVRSVAHLRAHTTDSWALQSYALFLHEETREYDTVQQSIFSIDCGLRRKAMERIC